MKNSMFCAAGMSVPTPLSLGEAGRGEGRALARKVLSFTIILSAFFVFPSLAKPYPEPMLAEGQVIAAFTPEHDIAQLISDQLSEAKKEVMVLAFIFTNRKITEALIRTHKRGVKVEVVADREQTFNVSQSTIRDLVAAGVPVWLDNRFTAAHNKVMVIDKEIVITGSFNFTQSAQNRNAENVLVSLNARKLAARYTENYLLRKAQAQRISQADLK